MDKLIVRGTEINVQWDLKRDDFLSLTDIAKIKDSDNPRYIIQNWLRNRNLFTSYECIRNSLICLFAILLLTAAPLSFQSEEKNDNLLKFSQVYSFMYSSDAVDYIKKSNVQNDVENSILNVIGKSETNDMPQTFGIVAEHSKLFIKCNVIGKTVEIILIEPYTDMDT